MSSGTNNFTPQPGDWRTRSGYYTYASNNDGNHLMPTMFPQHVPSRATPDANRGVQDTRWAVRERVLTAPLSWASFPVQPHSPMQIFVLDTGMSREPSPGFVRQLNLQSSASTQAQAVDSRLTQDEQKKALKKLRKEIYNPVPKKMTSRLSLYYRDRAMDALKERAKEKDEDGKRCAVCLEDFEPKEWVMLTPCDHMFHEDCIVPWVKSHGQCPVCRLVFCEQIRGAAPNITNAAVDEGELMSIIRAMEEALILGNTARW